MNSYDVETYLDENDIYTPYCVCFIYNKKKYSVYLKNNDNIIKKSIDLIYDINKKKKIFYIHNLNFDGVILINYLSKYFILDCFIRKMNIYYIKVINENNNIIEFRCSFKILPSSLKLISKTFNIPNKMIFPYKFSNKNNLNYVGDVPNSSYFNNLDEFDDFIKNIKIFNFENYSIEYCTRDVIITSLFMEKLNKIIKEFGIKLSEIYSAPSLSLKIFEKKFNNGKLKISKNYKIDTHVRNSYFGGRCEIYGNPYDNENIYHYDFSGMYGQCMLEKFPFGKFRVNSTVKNIDKIGFYCIDFYSKDMNIPILPHRRYEDNKLLFTNGKNQGVYWYDEICYFIENGGIIDKINWCIEFDNYDYVFNEFVSFFNDIKNKGNEYKTFGKLMINSLYGRFGMDENNEYSFFCKSDMLNYYQKKINIISYMKINNIYIINSLNDNKLKKEFNLSLKKEKSNVAIASAITSKARIKLHKAQKDVIKNGGRLLYSDTDSIFAAYKTNVDNQIHGSIFWDCSKDDTKIKKAFFANPKTYGLIYYNNKEIVKMKGYNQKNLSYLEAKEKFYNDDMLEINNYQTISKKDFNLKNISSTKKFDFSVYNKRKFIKDKKTTEPFFYINGDYK